MAARYGSDSLFRVVNGLVSRIEGIFFKIDTKKVGVCWRRWCDVGVAVQEDKNDVRLFISGKPTERARESSIFRLASVIAAISVEKSGLEPTLLAKISSGNFVLKIPRMVLRSPKN